MDIHVSDLLTCPRRAWFDKKTYYPIHPSSALIVNMGTLYHHLLEQMEDAEYLAETIVEDGGVVGTVDAYFLKNGWIIDYKTTRNLNLRYVPRAKHVDQVNVYAHLLRKQGKDVKGAAIQYIDLLGPSKCPHCKSFGVPSGDGETVFCPLCEVPIIGGHNGAYLAEVPLWPVEETDAYVNKRRKYLEEALKDDSPPEHTEPDFLCRYCPFLNICDDGLNEVHKST